MKILIKKNNGLVNIGEGKIYSKSQLIKNFGSAAAEEA